MISWEEQERIEIRRARRLILQVILLTLFAVALWVAASRVDAVAEVEVDALLIGEPEAVDRLWCLEPGPVRDACARQGCVCKGDR